MHDNDIGFIHDKSTMEPHFNKPFISRVTHVHALY